MSNATTKNQKDKYRDEYVPQARKLAMLGYTDKQLADFFGVAAVTWHRWKKSHPELHAATAEGKDLADGEVAASLYQRATGYSHPDVDIKVVDGEIVQTPFIRHYPPDTTACIFWLKNRQRQLWRDKPQPELLEQTRAETARIMLATEKLKAEIEKLTSNETTPLTEIVELIRKQNEN